MIKHRYIAVTERDEDGVFIGTVPALKGCYSYGETLDALLTNLKEAIEAHLEAFGTEEKDLPVTRFTGVQEVEVEV